jgi:hypothetical protein
VGLFITLATFLYSKHNRALACSRYTPGAIAQSFSQMKHGYPSAYYIDSIAPDCYPIVIDAEMHRNGNFTVDRSGHFYVTSFLADITVWSVGSGLVIAAFKRVRQA